MSNIPIEGNDDSCSIWLYYLDSEEKKEIKQGSEDSITTCAWFPGITHIYMTH